MLRSVILILSLFIAASQAMAKSQQIPLEYFNHLPAVEQPSISPDGKHIAVILNQAEFTQVAIVDYDNHSNVQVILQLGADKYRIDELDWANDERILVTVSQPYKIENYRLRTTHLYSASIDGKDVFELRQRASKGQSKLDFYFASPELLSLLQDDSEHVLVTINDRRDNNYSSVFKVNVTNGEFEKYLPNGNRIVNWGVTPKGGVLLAIGVDKDPDTDISYIYTRKDSTADWQLVKTRESYKTETFSPQLYDPVTNTIIVLSDHIEDESKPRKTALWKYDIKQNKFVELLGEAPDGYDVTGTITRLEGNERNIIGFTYNDGFVQRKYFNNTSDLLSQQIAQLFSKKGLTATLWDWDRAKNHYIVATVSDTKPVKFYLFDKQNKKLNPWYGQYPRLNKVQLTRVQPFYFEARDGMKLNGYLTLPENVKNPPVVLFPHGGPFARDSQYFNPFVQMFASRGYAVLQVNFRGSTGFGNDYETAGYLQWGKKMQTDLIDALDWVAEKKLANTESACIVGASYGGYAALVAGYQTPKRFKCIASIAGIADLTSQIDQWKRLGYRNYVTNAVSTDIKEQKQLSPVEHADKFKAPVLLIHGKADTRVSFYQSEAMFDALEKADKEVTFELFDFGTHHLNDSENLRRTMILLDAFLADNLG
ncbi:peptidase S9 [Thalassotalea insulae]|uniref:Peptidase S9 n=1 Tax=Thalassotalea insulae TaxID=2056778 RepID=A0ABQ6GVL7_9GAMM|nr:S9 family peptidase [Thalassotalea insulae]GLX79402.1 peptidase S9 [Thalassotalea insulae]